MAFIALSLPMKLELDFSFKSNALFLSAKIALQKQSRAVSNSFSVSLLSCSFNNKEPYLILSLTQILFIFSEKKISLAFFIAELCNSQSNSILHARKILPSEVL